MVNFFLHIFDVLQRRRSLCMWLLTALTAVLFVMVASLKYNENIFDFLPVSGNEQKAITLYQDISGGQRLFAMFRMKDGETPDEDRLTEAVDSFAQSIQTVADAGHITENIYLASTSLNLGGCAIAAVNGKYCDEVFGLDGIEESIMYAHPVGTISEKDKEKEEDFYRFVKEQGL